MIASCKTSSQPRFQPRSWVAVYLAHYHFWCTCAHITQMHIQKLFWTKRRGVGRELGAARAGEERTWSRAGGQGADERGFMVRHECILFIFSRTLPTRLGTDIEANREEEKKTNGRKLMQKGLSSMSTPSWGQCVPQSRLPGVWCLSLTPSTHPRSLEVQASHHSTWLPLQLFICVNASDRRCLDCTKTSGPGGRDKARQDRMWKEAGVSREMRSTSHNTICTNSKVSAACPAKGGGPRPPSVLRGWLSIRENLRNRFWSCSRR